MSDITSFESGLEIFSIFSTLLNQQILAAFLVRGMEVGGVTVLEAGSLSG